MCNVFHSSKKETNKKPYTQTGFVLMETSIANFNNKLYITEIQTLAFRFHMHAYCVFTTMAKIIVSPSSS